MPKKVEPSQQAVELLRTMNIVQLALAGVPGAQIRKIVGVGMNDVTRVTKALRSVLKEKE